MAPAEGGHRVPTFHNALQREVHTRENAELAEQFITAAMRANDGQAPTRVPADRGMPT